MASSPRTGRHGTTNRQSRPDASHVLRTHAAELGRRLPQAMGGDGRAVHRARVASRRLREALPLLLQSSGRRRRAVRAVRRVTRALGGVREMDVAIVILDDLAARPEVPHEAVAGVRAYVVAERDRRRERMLDRLHRVKIARLERRLGEAADLAGRSGHDWPQALRTRIERRAERLEAAVERVGRMYAPDGLHQVRIAAKKLRYTLEIAAQAGMAAAGPLIRILRRTQDTLGRLHDLQIILEHVAAVQSGVAAGAGSALDGLRRLSDLLEEECRHLHAQYTAQVRILLELTAMCRSGLLPGGRLRRTPLKMSEAGSRSLSARPA